MEPTAEQVYTNVLNAVLGLPGELSLEWQCSMDNRTREHRRCFLRHMAFYILHRHYHITMEKIGEVTGHKHCTVSDACELIAERMSVEAKVWDRYANACRTLGLEPKAPEQRQKRLSRSGYIAPMKYTGHERAQRASGVLYQAVQSIPAA